MVAEMILNGLVVVEAGVEPAVLSRRIYSPVGLPICLLNHNAGGSRRSSCLPRRAVVGVLHTSF